MKAAMIITGSGPVVVLTSYGSLTDEDLLQKLHAKGVDKFIAGVIMIPFFKHDSVPLFDRGTRH